MSIAFGHTRMSIRKTRENWKMCRRKTEIRKWILRIDEDELKKCISAWQNRTSPCCHSRVRSLLDADKVLYLGSFVVWLRRFVSHYERCAGTFRRQNRYDVGLFYFIIFFFALDVSRAQPNKDASKAFPFVCVCDVCRMSEDGSESHVPNLTILIFKFNFDNLATRWCIGCCDGSASDASICHHTQ